MKREREIEGEIGGLRAEREERKERGSGKGKTRGEREVKTQSKRGAKRRGRHTQPQTISF